MSILQPLEPFTSTAEARPEASGRPPVRILLAGDGETAALDLRRLIAADPDLVGVGQAVAPDETIHRARARQPDVVVLDRTLSRDTVLLARELVLLDHAPAVLVRSPRPEPLMAIAAIVAGVRGVVSRSDHDGALGDAIRWIAANHCWLPDIPTPAVSRAASRLRPSDAPTLLRLLRGAFPRDLAADLGISEASLDARRSAMLHEMLGEPSLAWDRLAGQAGEPPAAAGRPGLRVAIAA